ncbi:1,4-dihydroxy-6-naphthoate synthase [Parapedobacter sp. ISTM3]|uniref:menaquinone biosynthesis family protein n=1 Tax=Parapedobacter sp. ISTM3 TaxID=2800130 RepID=UPI0019079939|nr:1,4-dihydroxy-6-naphthoate synthase [Parapedobacter sp. ISTM3]MBK1438412.1 1,4-dihydroxy-6-naphthoate synthase [Parapedobacter sp. ISTM3]
MKLSLGFSPCPNDTFIFDALIHHKIDTEGLEFEVFYEDVETLNQKAFQGELAVTKLSYHAYAYAVPHYVLLDAGSALGFGVGPLLICRRSELAEQLSAVAVGQHASSIGPSPADGLIVGIPGRYTTANFLLGLAFPGLKNKREMVFSDIERALVEGSIDLGLIIHENRFTYQDKGLHKVIDLGDYWEKMTQAPIPLGGIVVKRQLPDEVKRRIERTIRRSVEYAFANPTSGIDFIRSHAQEMSEDVLYKHIELYVNRFSRTLGAEGRLAIQTLFDKAWELGVVPRPTNDLFLS